MKFPTNISTVAQELNVTRATIYRHLKSLGYDQTVLQDDLWKTRTLYASISHKHLISLVNKLQAVMDENKQLKSSPEPA